VPSLSVKLTSGSSAVERDIRQLKGNIETYLVDGRKGEIVRAGLHITIMGEPNAGKSSLMNALGERFSLCVMMTTTDSFISSNLQPRGML